MWFAGPGLRKPEVGGSRALWRGRPKGLKTGREPLRIAAPGDRRGNIYLWRQQLCKGNSCPQLSGWQGESRAQQRPAQARPEEQRDRGDHLPGPPGALGSRLPATNRSCSSSGPWAVAWFLSLSGQRGPLAPLLGQAPPPPSLLDPRIPGSCPRMQWGRQCWGVSTLGAFSECNGADG